LIDDSIAPTWDGTEDTQVRHNKQYGSTALL